MSNCPDLCTADKCRELEAKIEELEFKLFALESELIAHTNFAMTNAHPFDLNVTGLLQYNLASNSLTLDLWLVNANNDLLATGNIEQLPLPFVTQWEFNAHKNTKIPDAHSYDPNVLVDIFPQNDGSSIIKVTVDGFSDEDSFNLEPLELKILPIINGNAGQSTYDITVSLGNKIATDTLEINILPPDFDNYFQDLNFFFRIDDLDNNDYRFTIQIGERVRSQILDLPRDRVGGGGSSEEPPDTTVSITGNYDAENNNLNLSVTVNGISSAVSINLDDMPFDDLKDLLNQILTAVNFELGGQYEIGKTKTDLTDENGNKQLTYSAYQTLTEGQEGYVDTTYTGTGFNGVNQALLNLDKKLTSVHKDLARAIDPELSVQAAAPTNCYSNLSREDYTDEEWELIPAEIQKEIEKTPEERFNELVNNNSALSELAEPLLRSIGSLAFKIPNIPAFFAVNFASNFLITQLAENDPQLDCSYAKSKLPTEIETITIVASPEVQSYVRDTFLILDFTTVEAFPKLNETKSKWRVQIPKPIEEITWEILEDIRWFRGGLYAKIEFVGRKNFTSGWFRDEDAVESYFGGISRLTSLETKNIICSYHTNPKVTPKQIETRVYRAFKVFMGDNGEPNNSLTEVIRPPIEIENQIK